MDFFEACLMIESVFFLLLVITFGLLIYAFVRRDSAFLALGAALLICCGLLLLDASPNSGFEETHGFKVRYVDDNNVNVDLNTFYRNARNDVTVNVLGQLFLYGGVVGLMASLGFLVFARHRR